MLIIHCLVGFGYPNPLIKTLKDSSNEQYNCTDIQQNEELSLMAGDQNICS